MITKEEAINANKNLLIYDEYRRIGYRLKPISKYRQLTLFDIMKQNARNK